MGEVVGVDLGGTNVTVALVGDGGRVVARGKTKTPRGGPDAVVKAITRLVADVGGTPSAVGVGAPGPVRDGVVVAAPNLPGWDEPVPLAARLRDGLGVPLVVDNDATVAAVGEWQWGAGRGSRFLLCMTLGTGVGGGLVLDGRPYRGAHGGAGEFGHMTVQRGGAVCGCGRRGCVEAYAGRASMERMVAVAAGAGERSVLADRGGRRITSSVWAAALDGGDALAQRLIGEAVEALGAGAGSVVNLLDLDTVVVAGGLAERLGQPLADRIAAASRPYLLDPAAERRFVVSALGDDAGVLGAAAVARSADA